MIDARQWLDLWAPRVEGLEKIEPGYWCAGNAKDVSYPSTGHSTLADIEDGSRWFAHRNAIIVAAAARFPCDGPMLDVGGGNGFVSLGLLRQGMPAVVVEPGPAGVAAARERGLPAVEAAYESLKIPDGSVAGVGLFDVLEHIEKDLEALISIRAALAPGGRLYVAVPAHQWLWSDTDRHAGHFRRYSRTQLVDLAGKAGFEVEYATYYFSPLLPAIYLVRVLTSGKQQQLEHGAQDAVAIRREHQLGGAAFSPVREPLFHAEATRARAGKPFPFGASCLLVARKT